MSPTGLVVSAASAAREQVSPGAGACLALLAAIGGGAAVGLGAPADGGDAVAWLGRLSGVGALACLLLAAVLSVRVPGFDRPFGGLTQLWILHHRLGLAAFVLALAHPPLMALASLPQGLPALGAVLLPGPGDWPMLTGYAALAAMVVFLAPSFQLFGRPEYQRWKALHFLAGVALAGALVHTLATGRALPGPWAAAVWGGLGGLALAVFVWRAALARTLLRRRYTVTARERLGDREVELSLRPRSGEPLAHRPGQFVYLTPHEGALAAGEGEEHPFTLSSAPGEPALRVAIKALGDASSALQDIPVDADVRVEGPYGDFLPARHRREPQLWIGGGIGVTPFVSAARSLAGGAAWGPVELVLCVNDPSRAIYRDALIALAEDHPGLRVHPHYFAEQGPLSAAFLTGRCPDAAERRWFVCGPPPLTALVERLARGLGVPRHRVHTEAFDFL